ncbi:MAG: murein transglycosylase, partial [Alphaproteobacteria bacterium]|nr:murein transglycosylase [Alphaproteobacteria bacterium]
MQEAKNTCKNRMKRWLFIGIAAAGFAAPAYAQADALIEGAKLCTRQLPHYERQYGIPTHLLSAIATTESGRYHSGLKISVPWPWTINAEGKGYYFDTKAEAVAAARRLLAQGITSMDVGCMQVNLKHHPRAFGSLESAFEPETNVAYASSFLRTLYGESNSWKKAAADYHSKTPARGSEYVGLVFNSWYKIIDKLRAARMAVPDVPARQQVADNINEAQANPVQVASLSQEAYTQAA